MNSHQPQIFQIDPDSISTVKLRWKRTMEIPATEFVNSTKMEGVCFAWGDTHFWSGEVWLYTIGQLVFMLVKEHWFLLCTDYGIFFLSFFVFSQNRWIGHTQAKNIYLRWILWNLMPRGLWKPFINMTETKDCNAQDTQIGTWNWYFGDGVGGSPLFETLIANTVSVCGVTLMRFVQLKKVLGSA